jgi:acetyl-CoA decarbonylase/synthase complex subunit gamma
VETLAGPVPRVSTRLGWADRLGSWKVRWAIGRATYKVPPGLYAVGDAGPSSPVFVTANYKMSFDRLRAVLHGTDGWILVLDTRGINVWCAAGKGTFGTDELVRRIQAVSLGMVVNHRRLILPQLGATGVSAHRVEALCGWKVKFGPVRLEDIPACVKDGLLRVKPEHRRVRFPFTERAILVPVEMVLSAKYILGAAILMLLLSGLGPGGYTLDRIGDVGLRGVVFLLAGWLAGGVLGPLLLPWLPGRAFSIKGVWAGLGLTAGCMLLGWPGPVANGLEAAGWLLLATAIASFLTMNFTGTSTYTSLSGVRKEMRRFVPLQLASAVLGTVLWTVGLFF